ncbi:MRP family ATP-binding protein, partial [Paenibacillus sepulcri]|nr:MRP family ATP-binding protein [Paenibacillus sepulcri]
MLTREEAISAAEAVAVRYSKDGKVSIRDVMVKEGQVSLTVQGVESAAQPAFEAALREAMARLGVETVHSRFRAAAASEEGAAGADGSKNASAGGSEGNRAPL